MAAWFALAMVLLPAVAAAECRSSTTAVTSIVLPGTLSVPRDDVRANGTVLWDSGWQGSAVSPVRDCVPPREDRYWQYSTAVTATSLPQVFATSVPGVGYKIGWLNTNNQTPDFCVGICHLFNATRTTGDLDTAQDYNLVARFRVQLIKTGAIGTGTFSLVQPTAWVNYGAVRAMQLNMTGTTTIVRLSCVTPDITVALGAHTRGVFNGLGSVSPQVSFNVQVNSCPGGLNAIYYGFNPATSLYGNQSNGIVTLDGGSTASGVGVQLLYSNGTPVPFNTWLRFAPYVGAAGNYVIPLKARYYQIASNVTPGTANSYIWLAMSYQ